MTMKTFLAVFGLNLLLNSAPAAAGMPAAQCLTLSINRANEVLRVLDANNVPTVNIVRNFWDNCHGGQTGTWTIARRAFFTANNEFFQEFILPSGSRRYLRYTHFVDAHDNLQGSWVCPNGDARAFEGVDQIIPPGPAGANPNAYFDDINNIDVLSVVHLTCSSVPPIN